MDVRATRIHPDAMLRLLRKDEAVCDAVISSLTSLKTTIDNLLYSSEERLARALVSIAKLYEDPGLRPLPKPNQQDLANMIGVTRQRTNFLMQRFRKLGFLDYPHGLRVHDSLSKIISQK